LGIKNTYRGNNSMSNVKLRSLKKKDAPLMLEWMHDPSVVEYMQANFAAKKIEDCENFIDASMLDFDAIFGEASSNEDSPVLNTLSGRPLTDANLAIVDETDTYMGTVSLKHINFNEKNAEFAITVRKVAMGKGFSKYGIQEILKLALTKLHLNYVYWCVNPVNERAVRFYDNNGYTRVSPDSLAIPDGAYTPDQIKDYFWYKVD